MKDGIKYVFVLFNDKDLDLIFLADRWFGSSKILEYIASLGYIYYVRLEENITSYKDGIKRINAQSITSHRSKTFNN